MSTVAIGNVEVTAVLDTGLLMNPRTFLADHSDEFLSEWSGRLDERGLLPMAVTCYLVRSNGKNILVDTGLGGRRRPGYPPGHLDETLREAGLFLLRISTSSSILTSISTTSVGTRSMVKMVQPVCSSPARASFSRRSNGTTGCARNSFNPRRTGTLSSVWHRWKRPAMRNSLALSMPSTKRSHSFRLRVTRRDTFQSGSCRPGSEQ